MRNIINFDVRGQCICACVCNIFDGSESINFIFENDGHLSPQIEIVSGDTTTFYDLEVVGEFATFDFRENVSIYESVQFRFVDGSKKGAWFVLFGAEREISPLHKTVKVEKISSDTLQIVFVNKNTNVTDYSDDFEVVDGTLYLNSSTTTELKSIDVSTTTNDLVNKVTFNYEEKTVDEETGEEKIENVSVDYPIEYNSNDDVVKFGSIGVNWVE